MKTSTIIPALALALITATTLAACEDDSEKMSMDDKVQNMEDMKHTGNMKDTQNMKGMHDDHADHEAVQGKGTVKELDATAKKIVLAHEPIPALGWPAMTMGFELQTPETANNVAVGDTVTFTVISAEGSHTVTAIEPQ